MASPLAEKLLEGGFTVEATLRGEELEGLRYEPLYDPFSAGLPRASLRRFEEGQAAPVAIESPAGRETAGSESSWQVHVADFVSMDDGSGIVHVAPAFGQEDYLLGTQKRLLFVQNVDVQGRIVGDYPGSGLFVKEADELIMQDLADRGLLYRREVYRHTYPFCWRCDAPLLYYSKPSWYIQTTARRERLVSANREINWRPEHIKEGRFGEWLRNNVDWAISRERYWGTPLPIWRCEGCGDVRCIGSVAELRESTDDTGRATLDAPDLDPPPPPHRPGDRAVRVVRRNHAPRPGGDRRVVRLRRDALRAVPLPLRQPQPDGGRPLPGGVHLRGGGPDPGLVLQPPRPGRSADGLARLPQRHLPGAHPGRVGPQDEQVQGEHRGAVAGHHPPGGGRAALVPVLVGAAGELAALLREPGGRVRAAVPADPVEHLQLLRHLRQPGRLPPRIRRPGGPAAAGPLGTLRTARAGAGRDGGPGELQPDRCGPPHRGVRGCAVHLVRAAQPPPLLEEHGRCGEGGSPPDPLRLPDHAGAPAGPLHPLPGGGAVRQPGALRGPQRAGQRAPGGLAGGGRIIDRRGALPVHSPGHARGQPGTGGAEQGGHPCAAAPVGAQGRCEERQRRAGGQRVARPAARRAQREGDSRSQRGRGRAGVLGLAASGQHGRDRPQVRPTHGGGRSRHRPAGRPRGGGNAEARRLHQPAGPGAGGRSGGSSRRRRSR